MAEPLKVTVYNPETGESATGEIEPGNYMVICNPPCWLDGTQSYANGTTVVTVKGRAASLMGLRQVGTDG